MHWTVAGTALATVVAATAVAAAVVPSTPRQHGASPAAGKPTAPASATLAPGKSPAPTAPTPAKRKMQFGLDYSDVLTFATPAELAAGLSDAKDVGAEWIRVDFAWQDYQTWQDIAPDFSKFDKVVQAANARGLKILATIGYPPPWARQAACVKTSACPPADFQAFASFMAKAAARYGPQGVHTWEVWNEPNISAWGPTPDPGAYAKLLTATSKAIKNADKKAFIVVGGMAATYPTPGAPFIPPYDFLTALGKAGALKTADAVAYHPYPDASATAAASDHFKAISASPRNMAEALDEAGLPNMPIWITETGTNIWSLGAKPVVPATVAKELQTQAAVAKDLVQVLSANPHVATMFWYADEDAPESRLFFGLRNADGTRRPAFDELQKAIATYRKTLSAHAD